MVAIAHHVEVTVAESVKALAVDGGIQEFVLAEHVNGLVGYHRAGEQQPVAGPRPQPVHSLAGGDIVGFDFVALVRDNQIGVPCGEVFFHPPRALIVHNRHL